MHIAYTAEQEELRRELRAYFAEHVTEDVRGALLEEGHGGPIYKRLAKQLGTDGWLGIGWPTEYGGQGRSVLEQFVFFDEASRAEAPVPMIALNTVGPTLMRYGTDEQKATYLPGILAGELEFAIGYTEPNAGTDLASLQTRAVLDGDHYVVNGTKVFTSGADFADYIWLAARTDPDAKKHQGITIMLVSTKSAGFSVTPIVTMSDGSTTATYYDDVRVPVTNVIGDVNQGWKLITTQLNHERVALSAMGGRTIELFDLVLAWACGTLTADGSQRIIDVPWVATALARAHARLEAAKLLNWRVADKVNTDALTPADASMAKVFGTEADIEAARLMLDVLGQAGYQQRGSAGAVLYGQIERAYRRATVPTFGGGSNEVQREIMVWTGLGLPRGKR